MGIFEGKIPQCQEEIQKKKMDSVTGGQAIRMNQKKIAKHEEWMRRNIVFLMMWSLDCMWKPFFSVDTFPEFHSGRWAAITKYSGPPEPASPKTYFEYF